MRKPTLFKASLLFAFSLPLSSCVSSDHSKRTGEVRDVPYQARGISDPSLRKRIMVLPFLDTNPARDKESAKAAREILIRNLQKTENFVLVSPSDFPKDV